VQDPTPSGAPRRIPPLITPHTEFFWTGGASGELRFRRCRDCGHYLHPPSAHCPQCLGKNLAVAVVSGRGRVAACTVNHQPWLPGFPPPYVIAIVEIEEAPYVRLTTNIVGCAPEAVYIGMPVRVRFEPVEDAHLPLFEPLEP
jgi:uncharacterized OB-fold protein